MNDDPLNTKLWSNVPSEIYEYFFRKIYAGDRGIKQQLINLFFEALYQECKRRGFKAVLDLMKHITFNNEPKITKPRRKSKVLEQGSKN
jgi:hypothetical protein